MALKRTSDAISEATEQGAENEMVIDIRTGLPDGLRIDLGSLAGLVGFQNLPFEKVLGTGLMHLFVLARFMYAAKCAEATLFHIEVKHMYRWRMSSALR